MTGKGKFPQNVKVENIYAAFQTTRLWWLLTDLMEKFNSAGQHTNIYTNC